jgi:hypothetical protein
MRRSATAFATALSACAHSGAQRAARLSRGGAGAARRARPVVGIRWAAVGGGRPRSSFGPGGPALLTEDRQKPAVKV